MSLYVRVEGVNLENFLYDTSDLSTVRGGSLLLRESTSRVQEWLAGCVDLAGRPPTVTAISTGASAGLFSLEWPPGSGTTPPSAAEVIDKIRQRLAADGQLKHATHVVAACEEADFATARERLLAANRWEQMRAPSVAVPSGSASAPCDIDYVRPGEVQAWAPDATNQKPRTRPLSRSVSERREFGQDQKRLDFYEVETAWSGISLKGLKFTREFEELSTRGGSHPLNRKVAVLHCDGNKFGKIQWRDCTTAERLSAWDSQIRRYRGLWLAGLLEKIRREGGDWLTKEGRIRLETLVWGGDEFTIVVPAWKGWEVLASFFHESGNWFFKPPAQPASHAPKPVLLTHAAGLVFCHHNAPIGSVTRLATDLADNAKSWLDTAQIGSDQPQANCFSYQVLESFDHVGRDLREHRLQMLPRPAALSSTDMKEARLHDLFLPGAGCDQVTAAMTALKDAFPKGQLYGILRSFRRGGDARDEARKTAEALLSESLTGRPALQDALTSVFGRTGTLVSGRTDTFWLHIAELWDYIGE